MEVYLWGSGKHGLAIECKGWCVAKKNKRKRWNYHPSCKLFEKETMHGFIYEGGKSIEEDLNNIGELMERLVQDNM
jgi:hypothetical protein